MTIATKRPFLSFLAFAGVASAAAILVAAPAARASGIQRNAVTGIMYRQVFKMKAGVTYQFTTRNLSPGSDTILHVLSYPDGKFIAAGDDTVESEPSFTVEPYSTVEISPASTDRNVYLVVRGKPGTPDGNADFRILGVTNTAVVKDVTTNIQFSAGFIKTVSSLAANTHITTVEEPLGTLDTVLMVFGNEDTLAPLAFDDDDGIDLMSFARLGTACSSNCQIIVGTPSPVIHISLLSINVNVGFPAGPVSLIWDETIETAGHDPDRDGLSTELENIIGTGSSNPDTDGDGINDGFEVYGGFIKGSGRSGSPAGAGKNNNLLKFPKYGANPTAPDVFTEIDWLPACPSSDPACIPLSANPLLRPDAKRINAANVEAIIPLAAGEMNGAVRAHFDVGVATTAGNSTDQTNITFGDWGGANRLSDGQTNFSKNPTTGVYTATLAVDNTFFGFTIDKDCFAGISPARVGSFHHLTISDDATGGRTPDGFWKALVESAACALVHTNDASFAHELGHNFNLDHGGWPSGADANLNCKMNYASVMSYPNQATNPFGPGYSFGRFQDRVFNGFKMDESAGLGLSPFNDAAILNVFATGGLDPTTGIRTAPGMNRGFADLSTGAIDWNMDGMIQSGTVRAPVNWANETCGAPYLRANWSVASGSGVAFPTLTVADATAAKPQMYALATPRSGASVVIGTGDPSACATRQGFDPCTKWTWTSTPLGGAQAGLAVAGPYVIYHPSTAGLLGYLHQKTMTTVARNGTQTTTTFQGGSVGTLNVTGDPAAVEVNGRVKVFYIDTNNTLLGGELNEATNEWTIATDTWEDGTPIHTGLGIAVAYGAVRPDGQAVFAAIPNRDKIPAMGAPMPIEFARLSTTSQTIVITVPAHTGSFKGTPIKVPAYTYSYPVRRDMWTRIPLANAPSTLVAKPALAYVPFDLTAPDDGRFYLTYAPGTTVQTTFTQGNDTTAGVKVRALAWMSNQVSRYADADNQSRDFGRGVVLARFGQSIVGATYGSSTISGPFSSIHYFPAADGIVNVAAHDYDDNLLVRHNLACSVHGGECDDSP